MDLERLRRETAASHLAVEEAIPLMGPSLTRAEYVRCLQRMDGMIAAWEEISAACAPEWLRAMLFARRRRHLLARDLEWFGVVDPDAERPQLEAFDDVASLLGAMYVMEGSTLGGQLIARHVASVLQLETGQGNAFFLGHGSGTGRMWKEFCDVLRTHVDAEDTGAAIVAAQTMFERFGAWMQQDVTQSH